MYTLIPIAFTIFLLVFLGLAGFATVVLVTALQRIRQQMPKIVDHRTTVSHAVRWRMVDGAPALQIHPAPQHTLPH